jgi:hypothetical protein
MVKPKNDVSDAQKAAHRRHEEKRKSLPRLPGTRLNAEQGAVMDDLYAKFETKTEAILEAVKFYLKNH